MNPEYFIDEEPAGESRFVVRVRYGQAPSTECGRFKTKAEAKAWIGERHREQERRMGQQSP
jgi:hypothetical protein